MHVKIVGSFTHIFMWVISQYDYFIANGGRILIREVYDMMVFL